MCRSQGIRCFGGVRGWVSLGSPAAPAFLAHSVPCDEHGAVLTMRDSYGKTLLIENPAVKTYAKITQQANATAGKLLKLYRQVKK